MAEFEERLGIDDIIIRQALMTSLNLKPEQEFYLKIAQEKTNHKYTKLPKDGYIGICDYDGISCFLIRFKFAYDTYEFTSNCGYMSKLNYNSAFQGLLDLKYTPVFKINPKDKFYIQILDNISIYEITSEEDEDDLFNTKIFKLNNLFNINFNIDSKIITNDSYSNSKIFTIKFFIENLSYEASLRKWIMKEYLNLEPEQEFYIKIYKQRTTLQYRKLLKEGYLGLKDYDMGTCFLLKFKFLPITYELVSNSKYVSKESLEKILSGFMSNEYIPVENINLKNRFYIQILDEISIYQLDYEEDKSIEDAELDALIEAEVNYYNSLEEEDQEEKITTDYYLSDYIISYINFDNGYKDYNDNIYWILYNSKYLSIENEISKFKNSFYIDKNDDNDDTYLLTNDIKDSSVYISFWIYFEEKNSNICICNYKDIVKIYCDRIEAFEKTYTFSSELILENWYLFNITITYTDTIKFINYNIKNEKSENTIKLAPELLESVVTDIEHPNPDISNKSIKIGAIGNGKSKYYIDELAIFKDVDNNKFNFEKYIDKDTKLIEILNQEDNNELIVKDELYENIDTSLQISLEDLKDSSDIDIEDADDDDEDNE